MATVKFYKTIFRFTLFNNLPNIRPLAQIKNKRKELRLQYVCIKLYCDIFASGILFIETRKNL